MFSCSTLRLLSVQEPIGEALIGDFNLLKIEQFAEEKKTSKTYNKTQRSSDKFIALTQ